MTRGRRYVGMPLWPSAALGGLEILQQLAADERRFVWRAAASALHYLGKHHPEVVRPLVENWLQDERRKRAAEVALRYISDVKK
jgi:3-methyladenine DNA glycosylase AlkC